MFFEEMFYCKKHFQNYYVGQVFIYFYVLFSLSFISFYISLLIYFHPFLSEIQNKIISQIEFFLSKFPFERRFSLTKGMRILIKKVKMRIQNIRISKDKGALGNSTYSFVQIIRDTELNRDKSTSFSINLNFLNDIFLNFYYRFLLLSLPIVLAQK